MNKQTRPRRPATRAPIEFILTSTSENSDVRPPITHLLELLSTHRLLFIWYAVPAHVHAPRSGEQLKAKLFASVTPARPASEPWPMKRIIEFASSLDAWHQELKRKWGSGVQGRPLRDPSCQFPVAAYARWRLPVEGHALLEASYQSVCRAVGRSLAYSGLPLGKSDMALIRHSESVAKPSVIDETGTTWADNPAVWCDYPDRVETHLQRLEPLTLLEAGLSRTLGAQAEASDVGSQETCGRDEPAIELRSDRTVLVFGKNKGQLTRKQYDVVKQVLGAGPDGLTKDRLEAISGGARAIFARLTRLDPDWSSALLMAEKSGMGYRVRWHSRR